MENSTKWVLGIGAGILGLLWLKKAGANDSATHNDIKDIKPLANIFMPSNWMADISYEWALVVEVTTLTGPKIYVVVPYRTVGWVNTADQVPPMSATLGLISTLKSFYVGSNIVAARDMRHSQTSYGGMGTPIPKPSWVDTLNSQNYDPSTHIPTATDLA